MVSGSSTEGRLDALFINSPLKNYDLAPRLNDFTLPVLGTKRSGVHKSGGIPDLRPLVVRTVRLVVGAGSVIAEDAAQEALLELERALPRLREPEAARAYATRIAARVAIKAARKERRYRQLGLTALQITRPEPAQPEALLELKQAFDSLPARQRAVAVLRLHVGLTERETAEALGCGVGTVKRQLHDARASLARYLRSDTSETTRGARP